MKKVLLSVVALLGGVAGFLGLLRLLPLKWRAKLSQLPGSTIGWMMDNMPDEGPGKVIMSGVSQIEEQNEELLALMREQFPIKEP